MTDCDSCDNLAVVRKQREEIILLTNELQRQEEQINKFHSSNIKFKEIIKNKEKREADLEKKIKSLNLEINNINESLKHKNDELEQLKHKQEQKDSYIQYQSNKIFQMQTEIEKVNQELNSSLKSKTEAKTENVKLQSKIKDQSNRILEVKKQNHQLIEALESRNCLVKTSTEHIRLLEKSLLDSLKLVKNKKTDASTDATELNIEPTARKEQSKELDHSNEHKLMSILQDLKETWLESNLKYEEVKTLVFNELKDKECALVNNLDKIDRIFTSSPIP